MNFTQEVRNRIKRLCWNCKGDFRPSWAYEALSSRNFPTVQSGFQRISQTWDRDLWGFFCDFIKASFWNYF